MISSYSKSTPEITAQFNIGIKILRENPERTVSEYEVPAVLGYSAYMWNFQHSLEVARLAKIKFPNVLNVFGGPSIPRRPETLAAFFEKYPFVDLAVQGEGEITFKELLKALLVEEDFSTVAGIAYRVDANDGYIKNLPRPRITDLDILPSPYLDGTFDLLMSQHRDVLTGTIWETNRGCPFSCTFCDWGQATQSKVNIYGLERLYKELDWISENEIFYVYAADANFGIKKRDLDIAKYMAGLKMKKGFPGYFMINWMKNAHQKTIDIAETLRDGGIGGQVTLSMQSFDELTLEAIKRANIHLDTFRSLKAEYNKRNIPTYSELLLGLPGETYDSFCAGVIMAMSPYPKDHFNTYLCRVLENTEMAELEYRSKYALETRMCAVAMARRTSSNFTVFEEEEIIVSTSDMGVKDWRRAFSFGYLLSMLYNLRLAHVVLNFLHYQVGCSVKDYVEFLLSRVSHDHGVLKQVVDNLDRFQDSILNNEMSVMTVDGFGDRYWEPHEAGFLIANLDPESFYDTLKSLTYAFLMERCKSEEVDRVIIDELFKFQRLLSPLNSNNQVKTAMFQHDWLIHYRNMELSENNVLQARQTALAFHPPPTWRENLAEFAISQLTACNSESGPSCDVELLPDDSAELHSTFSNVK